MGARRNLIAHSGTKHITKRELFAAMAMQSFINRGHGYADVAGAAVMYADALIAELGKEKKP